MPIFEYRCSGCEVEFELLVRASTVPSCPECESQDMDKLLLLVLCKMLLIQLLVVINLALQKLMI